MQMKASTLVVILIAVFIGYYYYFYMPKCQTQRKRRPAPASWIQDAPPTGPFGAQTFEPFSSGVTELPSDSYDSGTTVLDYVDV
jgi:hypothetical protein